MTQHDPHGRPVDVIRTCYASWMRLPDVEGLVRVRWYTVPDEAPGITTSEQFTSSNWDEEQWDTEEFGERRSLRNMYADYRPCQAPPWAEPTLRACPDASGPQWEHYCLKVSGMSSTDGAEALNGSWQLDHSAGSTWNTPGYHPPTSVLPLWFMTCTAGGGFRLTGQFPRFGLFGVIVYDTVGPVDPWGPIEFRLTAVQSFDWTGPQLLYARGRASTILVTEDGRGLTTQGGANLIIAAGGC